jgi:hypothetical protein
VNQAGSLNRPDTTVQGGTVLAASVASTGSSTDRPIINVGQLTLGAEAESPSAMGSDLWAAEALQEAETELGVAVMIDRSADVAVRGAGQTYRSADPSTDLGLTA